MSGPCERPVRRAVRRVPGRPTVGGDFDAGHDPATRIAGRALDGDGGAVSGVGPGCG